MAGISPQVECVCTSVSYEGSRRLSVSQTHHNSNFMKKRAYFPDLFSCIGIGPISVSKKKKLKKKNLLTGTKQSQSNLLFEARIST